MQESVQNFDCTATIVVVHQPTCTETHFGSGVMSSSFPIGRFCFSTHFDCCWQHSSQEKAHKDSDHTVTITIMHQCLCTDTYALNSSGKVVHTIIFFRRPPEFACPTGKLWSHLYDVKNANGLCIR